MPRTRTRTPARRAAPRRRNGPTAAALRAMVRPIVKELVAKEVEEQVAKEMERIEDRLDAQDAREALAEPGGITHEELVKKLGQ